MRQSEFRSPSAQARPSRATECHELRPLTSSPNAVLTNPGSETEPTPALGEPDASPHPLSTGRDACRAPAVDELGEGQVAGRGRFDPVTLLLLVLLAVEIGVATGSFVLAPLLVGAGGPPARARAVAVLLVAVLTILGRARRACRAGELDEPETLTTRPTDPPHAPPDPDDRLNSVLAGLDEAVAGQATTSPLTVHVAPRVVEVFWDGPPPPPRPPWTAPASGWIWEADPDHLDLSPRRRRSRWAALVALGTTPTGSLWLNLAAFRVVALLGAAADVAAASDALRSQLQRADAAGALDLVLVPGPVPSVGAVADPVTPEPALSALWQRRARGGRGARRGSGRSRDTDPTRALVVAVGPETPARVVRPVLDAARGDRGVTCLVPGPAPGADLHLTVTAHQIHVPFLGDVPVRTGWAPRPTAVPTPELDRASASAPPAPPTERPSTVRVRLLGPVTLEGTPAVLPAKGVELVAYLACHRAGVRDDQIRAALWPQRPLTAKSWAGRVSVTRRDLGRDADGAPRLRRFRDHVGRLAPSVRCDIDELDEARRSAAAATPAEQPDATRRLRAALEMIRGRPFDAPTAYPWALTEQHVERAERVVVDAAHQLSLLDLAAGDTGRARWAAEQGLRACPASDLLRDDRRRARAAAGDPNADDETLPRPDAAAIFARLRAAVGALDPSDTDATCTPSPGIDH